MKTTISTNGRFDRLCNLDIATHYSDISIWTLPAEFLGAFVYWVTVQNPNEESIDIMPSLKAFENHVLSFFENPKIPEEFTFESLKGVIHEKVFENIPEVLDLNKLEPDFIDLAALARNMFYMVLREHITQD